MEINATKWATKKASIIWQLIWIQIQEEIYRFAGWEGGGRLRGTKNCEQIFCAPWAFLKNHLMPLFFMGCFPMDFQEVKRPLRTKSAKRPIIGKENSAQSFSDRSFWKSLRVVDVPAPSGHGCPRWNACFFQDFWPPWPKFCAGISARMTPGCPRDVCPRNFLFGLIFRSWH